MGLHIKNSHGKDFLYYLLGKDQLFIGPKGEYDKGDLSNVGKAIKHYDLKIEKTLEKYVSEIIELSNYIPQPERKEYLSKRSAELVGMLRRLGPKKQKVPIQVQAQNLNKELDHVLGNMVSTYSGNKTMVLKHIEKKLDEYLKAGKS